VIAVVNGAAIGGGVGLVAAVDMAFAEESAMFGFSEVRLGLIPAVISPFVIRKIGESHAREFFLTGERFSAVKAQEMGLIHFNGSVEFVREKVQHKIRQLKQGGPTALADAKVLIEKVAGQPLDKIGSYTAGQIAKRRGSAEGKEGMVAFLTKRKPEWSA
jgi:methylglutaconyl-CoA hydratase